MSETPLPAPLSHIDRDDTVVKTLDSGETLFTQSSATTGLFILLEGAIILRRTTQTGHTIVIHRESPGETFAEAAVFSETYHCTASALCKSVVVECKKGAVLNLLNQDKPFATAMLQRFAHQLQVSRRQVELLSIRAADERIIAALHDGMLVEDIHSFADTIALAPETVYRVLKQLTEDEVLIKSGRGKYHLNTANTGDV